MQEEPTAAEAALAELKNRLSDALASRGLNKTQLAARTGLSRTIVSEAFQRGSLPSRATVAALARALGLAEQELLDLRRRAAAEPDHGVELGNDVGPGRPIGQWDPHDLEVHPAGPTPEGRGRGAWAVPLSGYVPRNHDRVLAQAVRDVTQGRSRMLVLVGTSSTGKTRACWEAVQPLADKGWRLWHPFDPTRAQAALEELERVRPCTVVWLNEAQHYLGDVGAGERIAAVVHTLLTDPDKKPVLVLGTLWLEYDHQFTALPTPSQPDPHSRARELLAGRTLSVPGRFDAEALRAASALAKDGDRLLADALTRAHTDGRVTQDLAGAPELLRRYETGTPAAQALLEAAMDARRLGAGLHLSQTFLTDAATDYLSDSDYEDLTDDWAEAAYAELARLVHGKQAPLRRTTPRPANWAPDGPKPSPTTSVSQMFRLADYLEQHGRTVRQALCPPASFWHAAHTHLAHPDDLNHLADAARTRHRLRWAHHLRCQAADAGHPSALVRLAEMREEAGDGDGAEALALRAADAGYPVLVSLARMWEAAGDWDRAESLYQRAADAGQPVLVSLARMRAAAGDWDRAESLYQRAADAGQPSALGRLAEMREEAGDGDGAEALALRAADAGYPYALASLARMREDAGDWDGAEALALRAAHAGDSFVLDRLARMQEEAGDWDGAEALALRAADAGHPSALICLAEMRAAAGDRDIAESFYQRAADAGYPYALASLAEMRAAAGDWDGAEAALALRAADAGYPYALASLARMREDAGDWDGAEALALRAAHAGDSSVLGRLARKREEAGDRDRAASLYQRAADAGNPSALVRLARMRAAAGDWDGAEALALRADNARYRYALASLTEMRATAGDRDGAEALALRAAHAGHPYALLRLAEMREEAGGRDGAEALALRAAHAGHPSALGRLAEMREDAGDWDGAEALALRAAHAGHPSALGRLARMWEKAGDRDRAASLYQHAANAGDPSALVRLAEMREDAGDRDGAETLALRAADAGAASHASIRFEISRKWPDGLDPDGKPTQPWDKNWVPSALLDPGGSE